MSPGWLHTQTFSFRVATSCTRATNLPRIDIDTTGFEPCKWTERDLNPQPPICKTGNLPIGSICPILTRRSARTHRVLPPDLLSDSQPYLLLYYASKGYQVGFAPISARFTVSCAADYTTDTTGSGDKVSRAHLLPSTRAVLSTCGSHDFTL